MLELKEISTVYSGISTGPSIPGSARFMRLADLTDVKTGRMPAMACGVSPEVARALPIERGDLIVAARGGSTDVCTADEKIFGAYISLDLYLVRPQPERIISEYLRAFLELPSTQAAFASEKQGSGLARLPKEALEKIEVPVPPLKRQRLIAELALSFIDERRLLKRVDELKENFSREVLSRAITGAESKT